VSRDFSVRPVSTELHVTFSAGITLYLHIDNVVYILDHQCVGGCDH